MDSVARPNLLLEALAAPSASLARHQPCHYGDSHQCIWIIAPEILMEGDRVVKAAWAHVEAAGSRRTVR